MVDRTAAEELRDFNTLNVPASGIYKPSKVGVRELLQQYETEIDAATAAVIAGIKPDSPAVRILLTVATAPASLTAGSTHDGVVLAAGDFVARAFNGLTGDALNGVYTVQASGAAIRSTHFDSSDEIVRSRFSVTAGTRAGETWTVQNTAAVNVNTTPIIMALTNSTSASAAEVAAARVGFPNLDARLDSLETTALAPKLAEDAPRQALLLRPTPAVASGNAGDFMPRSGRVIPMSFDLEGRAMMRRPQDPEVSATGRALSIAGKFSNIIRADNTGVLETANPRMFGGCFLNGSSHPVAVSSSGEQIVLATTPALCIFPVGPDLFAVTFNEGGKGQSTVRLYGIKSGLAGGSIISGPNLMLVDIDGQSNGVGRGADAYLVNLAHPYKNASFMLHRTGKAPDERGGTTALDTSTQNFDEREVSGFDHYRPTLGVAYGAQSMAASFLDRMQSFHERDTGYPQLYLVINSAVGGASYSEIAAGTDPYIKKTEMWRRANDLAIANGLVVQHRVKHMIHGESDTLRYSAAIQKNAYANIPTVGIFDEYKQFHADNKALAIAELDQHSTIEPLHIYLQPGQRYAPQYSVPSAISMIDLMRLDPTRHLVCGPGYPMLNMWPTDLIHYHEYGQEVIGELMAIAEYERVNKKNTAWRPMMITGINKVSATVIDVAIHTPTTPLVFNTTRVPAKPGQGFVLVKDQGLGGQAVQVPDTLVIQSTVGNIVTLRLTFAAAIPTVFTHMGLGYAITGSVDVAGYSQATLPSGNICDSSVIPTRVAGLTWEHWLCADHYPSTLWTGL